MRSLTNFVFILFSCVVFNRNILISFEQFTAMYISKYKILKSNLSQIIDVGGSNMVNRKIYCQMVSLFLYSKIPIKYLSDMFLPILQNVTFWRATRYGLPKIVKKIQEKAKKH